MQTKKNCLTAAVTFSFTTTDIETAIGSLMMQGKKVTKKSVKAELKHIASWGGHNGLIERQNEIPTSIQFEANMTAKQLFSEFYN